MQRVGRGQMRCPFPLDAALRLPGSLALNGNHAHEYAFHNFPLQGVVSPAKQASGIPEGARCGGGGMFPREREREREERRSPGTAELRTARTFLSKAEARTGGAKRVSGARALLSSRTEGLRGNVPAGAQAGSGVTRARERERSEKSF